MILTYYWPPGSGPGVQRWLKFCKYLPEEGWEPIVVTVRNGSYPSTDKSLVADIPPDLKVFKTATLEPFALYNALRGKSGKGVEVGMGNIKGKTSLFARFSNYVRANMFVPDARVGWNIYSLPQALKLIQVEKPDVLITTGPPHSTHLVGERLHRENGIPWVADFRDPWTNIYYNAFLNRTESTRERDRSLENLVVQNADAMIVASPGLKAEFESRSKQIHFIPNGYDEADLLRLNPAPYKEFTLSYVGNLKAFQNVTELWTAIAKLSEENQLFRSNFKLRITGNIADEVKEGLAAAGIMDMVELLPFVPHQEAIERMMASHALLLPIPQDDGNKSILTGKLFEYLASRRPILSIGPTDGNAADILTECDKDGMIDYRDSAEMTRWLNRYFEEYLAHPSPMVTGNDGFKRYSRKGSTSSLASILNLLTE